MAEDDEAQATAEEAQSDADEATNEAEALAPPDPNEYRGAGPVAPPSSFVDKTITAPVGSAVTPPPGGAPKSTAEVGQGMFGASQDSIKLAEDKAEQQKTIDENEAARLKQVKDDQDTENVRRQMDELAMSDARQKYLDKKTAADEKVRDFKFHDYYDDPKHGSRVVGGIAAFLGGLGNLGGQNPGAQNQVLESIEHNMSRDHDNQLAYLNSAKYFADKQGEGVTDLLKQQQDDRHQAELDYANKKFATADKFAELAQTARGKQNYDAAMMAAAKIRGDGYKDQERIQSEIAAQSVADQRAKAMMLRAEKYKTGKGGKGSGSGGGTDAAAVKLEEDIQKANDSGTPLTDVEIARKGVAYGLPLNAKAGRTSVKSVMDSAAKSAGVGARGDRVVKTKVDAFASENGIKKIQETQRDLGAVLTELQNAPHNPLQQALAVEKAVSAARGGAASKQALALALNHLGGKFASLEGLVAGAQSGELGQKQMDNFVGFLTNQLGTAQKEGADASEAFDKFVAEQPPEQQQKFVNEKGRLFGGLHGFQGARAQATADRSGLTPVQAARIASHAVAPHQVQVLQ